MESIFQFITFLLVKKIRNSFEKPLNINFINLKRWPLLTTIFFLLISFLDWPSFWYAVSGLIISASSIYYAVFLKKQVVGNKIWFYALVALAIIYNPLFFYYYYSSRLIWEIFVALTIFFCCLLYFRLKKLSTLEVLMNHIEFNKRMAEKYKENI